LHLDAIAVRPYRRAHDQRRDHRHRPPPPPHFSGTGGRLRLRSSPLPPDPLPRLFSFKKRGTVLAALSSQREFDMYTPPLFKSDRAASLAFAEARGFGLACAWDDGKPIASPLPFYLDNAADGTAQALFHVARHNPLAKLADGTSSWLLAVTGADAYVSPDWYVSPDQVPTWLYQAVHLTGVVRPLSDDELALQIETLSAKFENWLLPKQPWTSAKMTAGRLDAMKKAIVGLRMTVAEVEGSFKLNQHKSGTDYAAVAGALDARSEAGAQQIAQLMRQARPQAFADETNRLERSVP
jgi:transcriptional regulator